MTMALFIQGEKKATEALLVKLIVHFDWFQECHFQAAEATLLPIKCCRTVGSHYSAIAYGFAAGDTRWN